MGQQVIVIEKPSTRAGVVRFEINRILTGMGHESYSGAPDAGANRPPDVLARRLFARGGIKHVHVNASMITVELSESGTAGIREVIEGLYTYYLPGVVPPTDAELLGPAE